MLPLVVEELRFEDLFNDLWHRIPGVICVITAWMLNFG
jgi:hypothetical protein